jgi:catechol 2,3-dioxygenase-like lactoylglutathione lyase family enzyme
MTPRERVAEWVRRFNAADADGLAALYHDNATNHQVALDPVVGREAIRAMFRREFAAAKMVCVVERIYEERDWAILEWRDPRGLRGCGFFQFREGLIALQRGYWDRHSFERAHAPNPDAEPARKLAAIALLIDDYDRAIAYYRDVLGFEPLEDFPMGPGKRWVRVRPRGGEASFILAKAANEKQAERVGDQTGGRVFLFLHTSDFAADYRAYRARGVEFLEEPRQEAYGTVAVFRDLYGNKWDLIQPKTP